MPHLRRMVFFFSVLGIVLGLSVVLVPPIQAASIDVTNLANTGTGTLRAAITAAQGSSGADIINITVSGTIPLSMALPNITTEITINNTSGGVVTVSRSSGNYSLFRVNSTGNLTIDSLTLTGGNGTSVSGSRYGGAIYNNGGTLTVTNSTISGNSAAWGGGILSDGSAPVTTITNSTFSGNTGSQGSAAIDSEGTTTITHTTIVNSSSKEAIYVTSGILEIGHSVITGSTAFQNDGELDSLGYNLIVDEDTWWDFDTSASSDIFGENANLGSLADNGGLTKTHLPQSGSPLIDAGDPDIASAPTYDQRGQTRIQGDAIDIGSVETTAAPVTNWGVNVLTDGADTDLSDSVCDSDATTSGNQCSLRAAIENANAAPGTDNVTFDPALANQTIEIAAQLPAISSRMTVSNKTGGSLTVTRDGAAADFSIFDLTSTGNLTIEYLTLTNGSGTDVFGTLSGGAILNESGTLTVRYSTLFGNSAGQGGAIFTQSDSTTKVISSTLSGNQATDGGAIYSQGLLTITYSTLADNGSGSGVYIDNSELDIGHTVVADNSITGFFYTISSLGYNWIEIEGPETGWYFLGTDIVGVDPELGSLANNGGPTRTHMPRYASPLIDAGDPALASPPATDQRGQTRVQGAAIDIGSVETNYAFVPPAENLVVNVATDGGDFDLADGVCDSDASTNGVQCSLRAALQNANADADTDTITFAPTMADQTITLAKALPNILANTVIDNTTSGDVTVQRDNAAADFTIFVVNAHLSLTLEGLTLKNGRAYQGGGIYNDGGTLTLTDSTVASNTALYQDGGGGGIFNNAGTVHITGGAVRDNVTTSDEGQSGGGFYNNGGTLTIDGNAVFSGNTASGRFGGGGAIYNKGGGVTIEDATFSNNHQYHSSGSGGAITNNAGTVQITRSVLELNSAPVGGAIENSDGGTLKVYSSTFARNDATSSIDLGRGGAIWNLESTVEITGSTFDSNTSEAGGAIYAQYPAAKTTIVNSTFSGNSAGEGAGLSLQGTVTLTHSTFVDNGIFINSGTVKLGHVAMANGGLSGDSSSTVPSLGYNFIQDSGSQSLFDTLDNDTFGVDPELGDLADNGGPTETHRPESGSPLINAGDPDFAAPPTTDQRGSGFARVEDGRIDIGSVELQTTTPMVTSVSSTDDNGTYGVGSVITLTVQFNRGVFVTGTPQLALNSGATAVAAYNGTGSGTDTLEFTYTVSDGDESNDLDYAATAALTLNGGTIVGADGATDATLTLPVPGATGSLAANKNLVVDGVSPTVDSVTRVGTTPTNAASVGFTVTFSEDVTGVDATDFDLDGIADASITGVTGSGDTYTVTVSTGSSDGTLRLDVLDNDTVIDTASNPLNGGFTSGQTYTIDRTAPTTTITSGPTGLTKDSAPTFEFSSEADTTFECAVLAGTNAPIESDWTDCATDTSGVSTYTALTLTDGPYTFWVQATDSAGNTETLPASQAFTVDTIAPITIITSGPTGPTNEAVSTFSFGSEADTTFECALLPGSTAPSDADWVDCTTDASGASSYTTATLSDDDYTFWVRATDLAGNTETLPASQAFSVDTTAPETTISSGPTGATSDTTPTFEFSSEADTTFECALLSDSTALVDADWSDCTTDASGESSYTALTLSDGDYIFWVRATDSVGNVETPPESQTFSVDTTAPETTMTGGPTDATGDTTPTFTASSDEDATFECVVLSGSTAPDGSTVWDDCSLTSTTASYTTGVLGEGAYTFWARATDVVGNTDTTPASRAFSVDLTGPETTITDGPTGPTNDTTPTFDFSSEADTTFECALLSGSTTPIDSDWTDCTTDASGVSSYTASTPSEGPYTFWVRATDAVGNTAAPSSQAFSVDTSAPETTITDGPDALTNDATATFSLSSESDTTFECVILSGSATPDGGTVWEDCTTDISGISSYTAAALADGDYTFWTRATDVAGNTDASPDSQAFTVDATAPDTTITSGPTGEAGDTTPTFGFTSEADTSFECALLAGSAAPNNGDWVDCTTDTSGTGSYTASTLSEGAYTFRVRATDAAANTDPTPDSRAFSVDTIAAATTINDSPDGPTNDTTPTFSFSSEANATFQCAILSGSATPNDGDWVDCTTDTSGSSSYTASTLAEGDYTFWVRAIDQNDNVETTPASRALTVDTTAPTVTVSIASGQTDPALTSPVLFTVQFDGVVEDFDEADVTLGGTAGASAVTVVAVTDTDYTVRVSGMTNTGTVTVSIPAESVTDAAGNFNAASNEASVTFEPVLPVVTAITRLDANPTDRESVRFGVTFSETVTGVDSTDFELVVTGLTGASIESVSGSGQSYVVTVSTGSGKTGTLALNLVDDDSILDTDSNPLGGSGLDNGNFEGDVYTYTAKHNQGHDNDDDGDQETVSSAPAEALQNALCENLAMRTQFALVGRGGIGNLQANGLTGDSYCHVINLDGVYLTSAAEIGNLDLINQGIVEAVDVYGLLPGGVAVTQFSSPVEICLRGTGSIYFISAVDNSLQLLSPTRNDGYLCVDLLTSGKLALVGGSPNTGAPPLQTPPQGDTARDAVSTSVVDCQATTTHAVRLRATPDAAGDGNIMTTLPYAITLQATEYTDGWYRVIYLDGQGWVSEDYLTTDGEGCSS